MKALLFLITLSLLTSLADAQMDTYFSRKGVVLLAQCAHPTNTFESGTYDVEDGYVLVNIVYKGGIHTRLKVSRGKYYFTRISVLMDDDFVNPFSFLQSLLRIVLDQYKDSANKDEIQRNVENMVNRKLQEWTGSDWALFIINLDYFSN